jgi:5-methylcytosine-specific restriction protein A
MTGRSLPEWRGKTPDTPVPDRVRARVFLAYGGRCYLSGRLIMPADKWELEHKLALGLGGENRETNLAPVLADKHKAKTAEDIGRMRKADRVRLKHLGIYPKPIRKLQGRGFSDNRKRGI